MATAALQRVARRLGGRALQEEVQLPRFLHSGKPACSGASVGGSGSAKGPRVDAAKEDFTQQIKSLKEGLYTTFARWERDKLFDGTLARQNGQLLEQLSVQVEPRPNDPLWRKHRRGKRVHDFMFYGGLFCSSYLALGGVLDFFTGPDHSKERKSIEPSV
ncbi:uncharacterized protein [Triticum aestivum]|uniref:uncharacterized protein n=1 Tax=Triticum aestivum TaxID=4565 RepID=UPI0008426A5A|nr:uncharacterized protein LOC123101749 [Triticum aestivum]